MTDEETPTGVPSWVVATVWLVAAFLVGAVILGMFLY